MFENNSFRRIIGGLKAFQMFFRIYNILDNSLNNFLNTELSQAANVCGISAHSVLSEQNFHNFKFLSTF